MYEKKSTVLKGVLMSPLTVGRKALVFTQGRPMLTSTVVAIHDVSDERVQFETVNTHYARFVP